MRRFYQRTFIGVGFALLMGCQTSGGEMAHVFPTRSTDASIAGSVHEAMMNNPTLAPITPMVHIAVLDKVVTLTGYVKTIRQSDTAGDVVRNVAEVKSVENNLIVRK